MKCNYDIYFNKDKLLNKLNTEKKLVEKFKKNLYSNFQNNKNH